MTPALPAPQSPGAGTKVRGECIVLLAWDLGFQVDLTSALRLLGAEARRDPIPQRRPAPAWFEYGATPVQFACASPLRVLPDAPPAQVEGVLYDFGVICLSCALEVELEVAALPVLGRSLFDHHDLQIAARAEVERLLRTITPAVTKPALRDEVEDYVILCIRDWDSGVTAREFARRHAAPLAGFLEADAGPLAPELIEHAIASAMAWSPEDLVIPAWNGAVILDRDPRDPEDVIAVLRHANVELLELRVLDDRLDALLEHADTLRRRPRLLPDPAGARALASFAEVQTDTALLFEGMNNAIKLVGDQYLARVYQSAGERLNLPQWDASVLRKLATADALYQKTIDARSAMRMEFLEIVIVLLIVLEVVLGVAG